MINTLGEVWAHNLSGNTVGNAYKLGGSLVAYGGSPAKSISAEGGRILVVNVQGEVWVHNLSGNTVGTAYRISGAPVAVGGSPVSYFISDSSINVNASVNPTGYYRELSTLTDNDWNYQSRDNLFFDGNTQNGESLVSVKQVYSDLSNAIFGSYKTMTAGYKDTTNYGGTHYGIDMGSFAGNPVKVAISGTATLVQNIAENYFIGIKADDGNLWIYGHLENYTSGIIGKRVEAGTVIGTVFDGAYSNPANKTGWMAQHTHLEVHKGHAYNRANSMSALQAYWQWRTR